MVVNKRKKNSRLHGSMTHGWGAKKKHRGSGHRGGKGNAGTGKRADCKRPSVWKDLKYFGKFGFKKKGMVKEVKPVNLMYFEQHLNSLLADKLIKKEGSIYVVDIEKLGFNKVLGCGKLTKKYKITSPSFSKEAIEKIKQAGGEAIELKEKIETPKVVQKSN
jgi:large subunit ribosomal protein L15